ncbi:VOC family protein [Roseicella aquatilis]|uniref:VOC family protein n=1 Tax=Roseicella aquatilis TaxID=2527868 RepID=UPI001F0EB8E3|nr:VOC family protein [Roseicella aquatilis]
MARYGFDHIHLRSPDHEATAAWFQDTLGAEVVRRVTGAAPRIDMTLGGLDLFVSQSDARVAASPRRRSRPTTASTMSAWRCRTWTRRWRTSRPRA